jgi:hypothetical protein
MELPPIIKGAFLSFYYVVVVGHVCVYKGKKKAREKDCRRNGPANKEMAQKYGTEKKKKGKRGGTFSSYGRRV